MRLSTFLPCLLALAALPLASQPVPAPSELFLQDRDGNAGRFSDLERQFIASRFAMVDLAGCRQAPLAMQPRLDYRRLELSLGDGQDLKLHVAPDVLTSNQHVLYSGSDERGWIEHRGCAIGPLVPVMALMLTAPFEAVARSSLLREQVQAQHSGLTSHEPNRLLGRRDSDDVNSLFMDFTLSSKYPILSNSRTINSGYDSLTEALESVIPGQGEYYLQLYLSFTGRFSQYLGSRESSPVVARRFNPELFYRLWSGPASWLDLGLGHESNGQRIDTPEAFDFERLDFVLKDEPDWYARDSLSRGWDYTMLTWQRNWNERLGTQLELRHFLGDGPLQRRPEEYNTWEDSGTRNRPRDQYDGVALHFQYNFPESRCLLGSLPICFRKVLLTQETGSGKAFDNNTTTLELTSDFFGLPIQLWTRSGYNSDLVDYYSYSNSWGLGIELISR